MVRAFPERVHRPWREMCKHVVFHHCGICSAIGSQSKEQILTPRVQGGHHGEITLIISDEHIFMCVLDTSILLKIICHPLPILKMWVFFLVVCKHSLHNKSISISLLVLYIL